jgi:integrase
VFNRVQIEDPTHPEGRRHIVCWDVLDPLRGSALVGLITASLLQDELSHGTRRRYMGAFRGFCAFIIEKPSIPGPSVVMVAEKYGPITISFTRYDLPIHAQDRPVKKRYALALLLLHYLYEFLRTEYLPPHAAARDYAAIVLQAETGLRVRELLAIPLGGESCDVDWETGRIRVFGKGKAYSGKRIRWVPLSPMSIAVLKVFIEMFRPMFPTSCEKDYLFLDNNGHRLMPYQYARNFRKIILLARQFGVLIPEDLRSHDLRRTFATNTLEENPMGYRKLLKQLGHAYPSSAAPYLVATDNDVEDQQSDLIDLFVDPAIDMWGKK